MHQPHGETGRRSKRAGGSLDSGVGNKQSGKGKSMRVETVCISSVLHKVAWGEKIREM